MITKDGIEYNLSVSPYTLIVEDYTFVFSSKMHRLKFLNKYKEHRKKINASLSNRFNLYITLNLLADIVLYSKIETRGFLIKDKEGDELCQTTLRYVGEKVMKRNLKKQ